MGAVSCDGSRCSCASTDVSVGSILLTRFWLRCPCLIWNSKNSFLNVLRFDSEESRETSNIHCCAVVYLEVTPQSGPAGGDSSVGYILLFKQAFPCCRKRPWILNYFVLLLLRIKVFLLCHTVAEALSGL